MNRIRKFLKNINQKKVQRISLLVILTGLTLVAGMSAYLGMRWLVLEAPGFAGMAGPDIQTAEATAAVNEQGTPLPPNPNAPSSQPTLTAWDGAGRVTVLLIGLDYRDWSAGEKYSRSDTMILLTLDPLTKTAGMLSIPRDMWVAIPGFKHGKINTAYYLGESYHLPGGGPGLAVKTVEQFLGVPINYYAQIDFGAFIRFIDEIGGVKIDVPYKIKVDPLGDNNTKTLKPGVQTLPGDLALAYARNRYTEGGDFDRAQRQQQVIMGIRNRILHFEMLPTLIAKAPTLYQQLSSGVHTNLGLDEIIRLALLAQDVPEENIKQGVFNEKYIMFGTSPDNLSIVIPIPDKIHALRDEIFATDGSLGPMTPGDAQQRMRAEAIKVALYNGSGDPELETRSAEKLRAQGMLVTLANDAGERYTNTTIVDHTGNPYTLQYLVEMMGISENKIFIEPNPAAPADVEVFLGNDWANGGGAP